MSFNLKRIAKFAALGAIPAVAIAGLVSGVIGASAMPAEDAAPVALLAPPAPPAPAAPPAPPAPPERRARERAERESARRAWLGVTLEADEDGVTITSVMDETPAKEAGLRSGDRIVSIEGKRVEEYEDLVDAMRRLEPGQRVDVVVDRNGSEKSFDVTLGERPIRKRIAMVHPGHDHDGEHDITIFRGSRLFLGVEVHPMSKDLRRALGATEDAGVLVNRVHEETPAAASGIQVGDIITAVDGRAVRRPGDIRHALMENEPGDTVPITVIREGGERTLDVTLQERDDERSHRGPIVIPFDDDKGVRAFAFSAGDEEIELDMDFDFDFDFDHDFEWEGTDFFVMSEEKQQELQQKLQEGMKKFHQQMQLQQEKLRESQEEIGKRLREMSERNRERAIRARQVNAVYDI